MRTALLFLTMTLTGLSSNGLGEPIQANEPATKSRAEPDIKSFDSLPKRRRIAALVDSLDTVRYVAISNPGGVDFMTDPLCQALAAEGADAVPALFHVLETDHRTIRLVVPSRIGQSTSYDRPVRSAAWQILLTIWPGVIAYTQAGMEPVPPIPAIANLRAEWAKDRKLMPAEQFLKVLESDSTDWRIWASAAGFLVKPRDEHWVGDGSRSWGSLTGPMTAEPLRTARGAEIMGALVNRALDMSSRNTVAGFDDFCCGDGLRIAHDAYKWEPEHAVQVLRQTCANTLASVKRFAASGNPENTVVGPFGVAIADRMALGDRSAGTDYAAMLAYAHFDFGFPEDFLTPLWTVPQDPGVHEVGRQFIQSLADRVGPPVDADTLSATEDIARQTWLTPILVYRPYRDLIIACLKNDRILTEGLIMNSGPNLVLSYEFEGGRQGSIGLNGAAAYGAKVGQKISFSVSDAMALELAAWDAKDWPDFSIAAPESERRKQKDKFISLLNNDGFDWRKFSHGSPFGTQSEH